MKDPRSSNTVATTPETFCQSILRIRGLQGVNGFESILLAPVTTVTVLAIVIVTTLIAANSRTYNHC